MIPKLTLDGGLLRDNVLLPAVRTLKTWDAEGRIEIFESDRAKEPASSSSNVSYGWPGAPKSNRPHPRTRVSLKADLKGISFQGICAVLFPLRDPNRLNITEVNDVAHLMRHHSSGRSIFVTTNAENFILEGKRERLASFKIIVLTPDEAVSALTSSEVLETASAK